MALSTASVTFRLRRIPHDVTTTNLPGIIQDYFHNVTIPLHVQVRSLAPSPDDWDTPSTQTATVEFINPPLDLQDKSKTEWILTAQDTRGDLLLDTHFLGFTQLNDVDSDKYEAE